jgi:ABC-type transport system involved in multi-copper enzyme maturation permease subunit/regulation of enolase protein 1 (concanavalin A-like superfamily)
MIGELTPVRGSRMAGRDGFAQLLRAEWTKFWTVRGWVVSLVLAAALTAGVTLALANAGSSGGLDTVVSGPGGVAVNDNFYFVHRSLAGNGSITVRVTSLADGARPGLGEGTMAAQPWAKAGIIVKDGTRSGSAYAAVMATPGHGVRMQYDFTHDTAGLPGAVSASSPRWLRLARSGDTVTGYDSADGRHWSVIGSATLPGLGSSVQAGMFAASPWISKNGNELITQASARFDDLSLRGGWSPGGWGQCEVGASYLGGGVKGIAPGCVQTTAEGQRIGSETEAGGTFAVTGTGDIAPYVPIVDILGGVFKGSLAALIALIALGGVFIGSEYRRGMIRTTFAGSPRRGRVVLAKAIVIGTVAFAAGLAGAAVALVAAGPELRSHGWTSPIYPLVSLGSGTGLRIVAGTAVLLALAAVFALAVAVMLRRGTGAITVGVALFVGPLLVAAAVGQPAGAFLLRVTPAAAFAVQQGVQHYPQATAVCLASHGCYPLAPWNGVAVLAIWTVAALAAAWYVVRRRDA